MTLRSPVFTMLWAMLWENWRLTRVEVAWRLALGIVGGMAVLAVASSQREIIKDFSAAIALTLIVLPHFVGWLSMAKLNGGRPGFPLYLLYTRPVRTSVLVAVPMAYLTALPSAIYLVSALLLRVTSDYAFPLVPVAAWIAALNLVLVATNWSTRNRLIQMLGGMTATSAWLLLAMHRLTAVEIPGGYDWPPNLWPTLFDFPPTDYALIGAIGLASFGLTVAAVARQRRGDGVAATPSTPGAGFWDWLVSLFRFPCPTVSATRAQVWFDLKSAGLPLLTIGVALAIVNPLLFAVSGPIDAWLSGGYYARPFAMLFAMISVLAMLALGANAFGIRARQGRLYAGAFEATQPYGTARLACLKVPGTVGLLAGRARRGRRECMDIVAAVGRCGLHPDVRRASEQSAACNQKRRRSADRVRAARAGSRRIHQCRSHGGFARNARSALGTLSPPREHRGIAAGALWSRAGPAGARTTLERIGGDPPGDVLGSRVSDRACDRLSPLAGGRGAASDAASSVWRRAGLGCIRGGMPDASAWGGCVAGRNARGGRGVDVVVGAPAADGQRPGALVAQPHSTYVRDVPA